MAIRVTRLGVEVLASTGIPPLPVVVPVRVTRLGVEVLASVGVAPNGPGPGGPSGLIASLTFGSTGGNMTVEEMAQQILAVAGSAIPRMEVVRWVEKRYRDLAARIFLRQLAAEGELIMPASVTTGTVDATLNSNLITGSAAAVAAWQSEELAGRYIRLDGTSEWRRIESVSGSTLSLASVWSTTSAPASGYRIVARHHKLHPRARWADRFIHERLHVPLRATSGQQIDEIDAGRSVVSDAPLLVAPAFSLDGTRRVEIYPPAEGTAQLIRYTYWPVPLELQGDDVLPAEVEISFLEQGVLADIYRREAGEAARRGDANAQATFANLQSRQETLWREAVLNLGHTDDGDNDAYVEVVGFGEDDAIPTTIRTAREWIWSRWP